MSTRVVNRRKEDFDEYIGRGSVFGNPFTHLALCTTKAEFQVKTRQESIDRYEDWVFDQPAILSQIWRLVDKVLGCYCAPLSCHGDILVRLVHTYLHMRQLGLGWDWATESGRRQIKLCYAEDKKCLRS